MKTSPSLEIFPEVFPANPATEAPRGNGERILVVDDTEGVLTSIGAVLTENGYGFLPASSGAAALRAYIEHESAIAVVISDIVMPGMTGPTLISLLRSLNPAVRIIAMSGYAPVSPEVEALHADEEHFLGKPFTASELLCMVRDTLREPAPNAGPAMPNSLTPSGHGCWDAVESRP